MVGICYLYWRWTNKFVIFIIEVVQNFNALRTGKQGDFRQLNYYLAPKPNKMTRSITLLLIAMLIFSSCSSGTWSRAEKRQFQDKVALDQSRSFFFTKYMQKEYVDCCMSKIVANYEYDAIKDIDLDDESIMIAVQIKEIQADCWSDLLTKYQSELEEKGMEVVFPDE
jgi:hypothetical protein